MQQFLKIPLIYVLVLLSGLTGLVYQVVWQKYLSFYLGSHAQATTIILSVFFLALSLGYHLIGRYSYRLLKHKILLYGVIEGLIGGYCLVSPTFFQWLATHYPQSIDSASLDFFLGVGFASLFIGFPTFLMGGTIPVLTDALAQTNQKSHRAHALIYAFNTLGAFIGTLLAGFYLIENVGLPLTLIYTSLVNIGLFAVTYLIYKSDPKGFHAFPPEKHQVDSQLNVSRRMAILTLSFLSGFYFFSLESLLIRVAGLTLGSSTYSYTIIVASFIVAIAAGSFIVSSYSSIQRKSILLLVQGLLLLSWTALYLIVPLLPKAFARIQVSFAPGLFNFAPYAWTTFIVFFVLLFIPVGLMGMSLPLLFNFLRNQKMHFSRVVGQIYTLNTLASTLGAAIGGYFLFYFLRMDEIFKFNLVLILISLPIAGLLTDKRNNWLPKVGGIGLLLGALMLFSLPQWEDEAFVPGAFLVRTVPSTTNQPLKAIAKQFEDQHIVFTHHGPDGITNITQYPDQSLRLYVNGNPNTSSRRDDRRVRLLNFLLPAYLKTNIKKVFFAGLGEGLAPAVATHLPEVERVDVAEIANGVIAAHPKLEPNFGEFKAKKDLFHVFNTDAFKLLRNAPHTYDVIISEPAHFWVAGVANLLTTDFLKLASSKLKSDGLYGQWFLTTGMDNPLLLHILNTFKSVFPSVTLWSTGPGSYLILGAKSAIPLPSKPNLAANHQAFAPLFQEVGLDSPLSPLALQVLTDQALNHILENVSGYHSLEFPTLNYRAPRQKFAMITASLDSIVRTSTRIRPATTDRNLYFFEKILAPEDQSTFFKTAYGQTQFMGKGSLFLQERLKLNYHLSLPDNEDTTIDPDFEFLYYGDRNHLEQKESQQKTLARLTQRFIRTHSSYLPAPVKHLVSAFPEHCKEKDCHLLKLKLLSRVQPPIVPKKNLDSLIDEVKEGNKNALNRTDLLFKQLSEF